MEPLRLHWIKIRVAVHLLSRGQEMITRGHEIVKAVTYMQRLLIVNMMNSFYSTLIHE